MIGIRVPAGKDFPLRHKVQIGSGAHSASYTMGIGFISSGTKSPKRETNNSPPFNIEFKMREAIQFLLHTSLRHGD
jgi:hypothetical protein